MRRTARFLAASVLAIAAFLAQGCGGKLPPVPAPAAPQYPDFVRPFVPPGVPADERTTLRHERGWRFLQANDLGNAEREFSAALERSPSFFPADTGLGFVNLARKDYRAALGRFDRVLGRSAAYAPALAGRGDALLGTGRTLEALATFERALAVDQSLGVARQRIQVLQLRTMQDQIAGARRAAEAGRHDEARGIYERAIAASPDSGFLYRDLASVQRAQGDRKGALASIRKAVALEPSDVRALTQLGELLEADGDFDGAVQAYGQALALEPGAALLARLDRARESAALTRLPAEFSQIPRAPALTRADLAALIGVRFAPLLDGQQHGEAVVMTDARTSWAAPWILRVVSAGVMDKFANHTFRPRQMVSRLELARAVSRVLTLAADARPALAARWQARPPIADIPVAHLGYPAVSQVVAAGVMPLVADGRFRPAQAVSGEEAVQVIDKVEALTGKGGQGGRGSETGGDKAAPRGAGQSGDREP